ncbi:MAG: hypothetical protein ACK55Z_31035 [bacterium]|jgi:hypothetical protein
MSDSLFLITIGILFILNIVFFFIGFIFGRITNSQTNTDSQPIFMKKNTQFNIPKNNITIDDSKYVTDISLAGMEKKYEQLGDIKTSNENITSSIDKLKNIKR